MKQRRKKLPVRLKAKPTKPHSTKKGARGYDRSRVKARLRREQESVNEQATAGPHPRMSHGRTG